MAVILFLCKSEKLVQNIIVENKIELNYSTVYLEAVTVVKC